MFAHLRVLFWRRFSVGVLAIPVILIPVGSALLIGVEASVLDVVVLVEDVSVVANSFESRRVFNRVLDTFGGPDLLHVV